MSGESRSVCRVDSVQRDGHAATNMFQLRDGDLRGGFGAEAERRFRFQDTFQNCALGVHLDTGIREAPDW